MAICMPAELERLRTLGQNVQHSERSNTSLPGFRTRHLPSESHNSFLPGFRLAVANPTSVYANMAEVMSLGADVVCLAETSAVEQVQHTAAAEFRRHGYRAFWSLPLSAHTHEDAAKHSLRGHAAGVAVLVRGPNRPVFNAVPPDFAQSLRYAEAVVRIGAQEALVVALYGFPSNHPDAQDQNQHILSLTLQRVMSLGLPTVVAGDFNTRVVDLPVWEQFQHCGFHELHQSFPARFGKSLPNTCCGATAHDSMLLSQSLFPLLQHVWVDTEGHLFSAHAPVHVTLSVPRLPLSYQAWRLPDSWEALDPDPALVEASYARLAEGFTASVEAIGTQQELSVAFRTWAQHWEQAVDTSLRQQHAAALFAPKLQGAV